MREMTSGKRNRTLTPLQHPCSSDRDSLSRGRPAQPLLPGVRPAARGKFLFAGREKLYVRGVTYGTFRPDGDGVEFPNPERVERDFDQMARMGVNAVRTYTPPPLWMMDAAAGHGLRLLVGLPVERSAAFLDYRTCARETEKMVRSEVAIRAGHPAVLGYAIGNEIPASIVRWHGRSRLERFLDHLYKAAKAEDPEGLVTYVNYPSTEYLQLPFLDFVSFNVYLESESCLEGYLARLHNIAGERPVLMAEIGLDSLRNGEQRQADFLREQLRSCFALGCAGLFVYSWTDEWYRGGAEVEDWRFGITDRERKPKPAASVVEESFADVPFGPGIDWPRVSVIVCTYNGARTIGECCRGLRELDYPDYEVIVVDDGSTDHSGDIAAASCVHLIRTPNRGLSAARNTGLGAATGEIVAYIDDDAYPDPQWLKYLVHTLVEPAGANHAGSGGPNLPPAGDSWIADCVARAPGGPSQVLISDRLAEHIPGCNMAFRRRCLEAVGGFDAQFRTAGDDVDLCWRLQQRGWTLGFSHAAVVWHHRRNSVRRYLRQQIGYGRAEALLECKWPDKYNAAGQPTWSGRVYDATCLLAGRAGGRIYHGVWGLAPYQMLYRKAPGVLQALPMRPEWYLAIGALALLSALSALWEPLQVNRPLLLLLVAAPLVHAGHLAFCLPFRGRPRPAADRLKRRLLIATLHLLQPPARLSGRLGRRFARWRSCGRRESVSPRPIVADIWSRRLEPAEVRLRSVEGVLRQKGYATARGNDYDRWDLQVRGGLLGSARLSVAVEFHGDGRQLLRFRAWPRCSALAVLQLALFFALGAGAAWDGRWLAAGILGTVGGLTVWRCLKECSWSMAGFLSAVRWVQADKDGEAHHAVA